MLWGWEWAGGIFRGWAWGVSGVETVASLANCRGSRSPFSKMRAISVSCALSALCCPVVSCPVVSWLTPPAHAAFPPPPRSQEILNGGVDICREAGIPLAGGHSIDSPEPIFGLVVTGVVDPQLVKRNSAAQVCSAGALCRRCFCSAAARNQPVSLACLLAREFGSTGTCVWPPAPICTSVPRQQLRRPCFGSV